MSLPSHLPSPFRSRARLGLRIAVVLILGMAAVGKAHQLATVPTVGDNWLDGRLLNMFVVEFELFFAVWLLFGLLPKLTWAATVGLFSVFASVSLFKAVSGESSCNCFGSATVNPWLTSFLDLGIIGLLIAFRPVGLNFHWREVYQEVFDSKKKIALTGCIWLLLGIPAVYVMTSVQKSDIAELGTEFSGADGRKTVLLEPEKWVGEELPILRFVNIDTEMARGKYRVLFFRDQCEKCHAVLSDWLHRPSPDNRGTVCVRVGDSSSFALAGNQSFRVPTEWNAGEMNRRHTWVISTPVVVHLDDGVVVFVQDDF